ncbi:DUF2892 domain-containing protein [Roseovarius sp. SCSIO 43702]|uniref:YgaP family membrane protein n=1 Tax=Roseovarius sp. SCSIO 43702 TaxID=2823043 RepID=UPI001C737BA0|nr:DUF2892 domain-containing protein [Roseovarius sp. SCSIO 43702]QYX56454.1 DUF2892 domain-containing protein [Roseovarius sp. SCSIO 43702]
MSRNMGSIDRGLRLVIAVALLVAAFGTTMLGSGILYWLALIVAGVFILTALVGTCPLYRIAGLKTCGDC